MVKILIKKTNKEVTTPKYKTYGSSGVDLSAFLEKKVVIKPNSSELIPTGLQVAIPEELEIQIRPRSGLAAKESIGVLNSPGTIDSDYSCLLYTSPSPRDMRRSRMPSSA